MQGDFNTRTGKYPHSFCHDGNKFITNERSEFSTITNFVVEKSSPLSGYSPTLTWLRVKTDESFSHIESLTILPKQFISENDSAHKFRDTLRCSNLRLLIRDYLDESNPQLMM